MASIGLPSIECDICATHLHCHLRASWAPHKHYYSVCLAGPCAQQGHSTLFTPHAWLNPSLCLNTPPPPQSVALPVLATLSRHTGCGLQLVHRALHTKAQELPGLSSGLQCVSVSSDQHPWCRLLLRCVGSPAFRCGAACRSLGAVVLLRFGRCCTFHCACVSARLLRINIQYRMCTAAVCSSCLVSLLCVPSIPSLAVPW